MSGRPLKEDGKLPADFVSHISRIIGVHLACGNWPRAIEAVNYAERLWRERVEDSQCGNGHDVLSRHVSSLKLDARTLNYIDQACNGTIGALVDCFPDAFVEMPGIGKQTIKTIAHELCRIRAISRKDAEGRLARFLKFKPQSNW